MNVNFRPSVEPGKSLFFGKSNDGKKTLFRPVNIEITEENEIDPFAENVSLLLHFNQYNNQNFIDSSFNNYPVSGFGNISFSSSIKKFGDGAVYFNDAGAVQIPRSTQIANFGTGDFTIEWWEYLTNKDTLNGIFCYGGAGQSGGEDQPVIGLRYEGNILRVSYNRGDDTDSWVDFSIGEFNENDRLVNNQWVHVAVVRQNGILKFYRNGNSNNEELSFNFNLPDAMDINFPQDSNLGIFNGSSASHYLDDFRITKGVARYTGNFTPPIIAFPNP